MCSANVAVQSFCMVDDCRTVFAGRHCKCESMFTAIAARSPECSAESCVHLPGPCSERTVAEQKPCLAAKPFLDFIPWISSHSVPRFRSAGLSKYHTCRYETCAMGPTEGLYPTAETLLVGISCRPRKLVRTSIAAARAKHIVFEGGNRRAGL